MIVMISWSGPINQKYSPGPTETICGANVRKKTLAKAQQIQDIESFNLTRSYAALRAEDLDWIVGPGYSLGRVHSGEKP